MEACVGHQDGRSDLQALHQVRERLVRQRLAGHGTLNIIEPRCERGTAMPTIGSSRRAFIKTMGVVAAAATSGRAEAAKAEEYKPQDQKKLTQTAARYQDRPKENESCASCPYFVLPGSCVLVEGEISANGWCPMYTTFSPLDRGAHG
jgi:hypothetical protein